MSAGSRADDWRPTCTLAALADRAAVAADVRAFFHEREVLEVHTPVLGRYGVTDVAIEGLEVPRADGAWRLQTSPEYHMKRLLAAGAPAIFQLAPAFRAGERGRLHNSEFHLLEWYRPGFDLDALMAEVAALVSRLLGGADDRQIGYDALLTARHGFDAGAADAVLAEAAGALGLEGGGRREHLDLLAADAMGALTGRVFVVDYPADQAALARTRRMPSGAEAARRFELVIDGIEIANGYDEVTDAGELRRRFEADIARRRARGQAVPAIDERLMAAQVHGLPPCAGVALGFDRLLMLAAGAQRIDAVMAFPEDRA